jgi:MoaA/NifB/PqqE/SkfB family radical SAM enzyme
MLGAVAKGLDWLLLERSRARLFGGWELQGLLLADYVRMKLHPAAPPLPRLVQLEPTRRCNLECTMCIRRKYADVDPDMSFETFRRIVAESFPHRHFMLLYGQGEPLLCADLARMIRFERGRGNFVVTVTNGTLLDRGAGRDLLDSGLNLLRISIDGASRATYESIRQGASFDAVMKNVEMLSALVRDSGAPLTLALTFMALKENHAEIPDMVRLASDLGIGILEIKDMPPYGDSPLEPLSIEAAADTALRERLQETMRSAVALARRKKIALVTARLGPGKGRRPCLNPWFKTYITCGGLVTPCSRFFSRSEKVLGDLREESFGSIWHGRDYAELRKNLAAGLAPLAPCRQKKDSGN